MYSQPDTEQKRFRENLRALYPGSVIHHCVGRKGKHNKIEIGHWWILGLSEHQHKMVHANEMPGRRKDWEKEWFEIQMESYFESYHRMPVPDEVLEAIEDYHL